jgi:dephospho-CoA kinase
MKRNNISEEEALRKISAQMPIGVKLRKADIAIDNSGSMNQLVKVVPEKIINDIY